MRIARRTVSWAVALALLGAPATAGATGYVYAANLGGTVSQYAIGPSGQLTPLTPAQVPASAGAFLNGIAVSPDGKSAYMTCFDSVCEYNLDARTGALSPKNPATVPTGTDAQGVVVAPDGKSVYVTNGDVGTVSQYNVDPVTGVLSPKSPATVPAGASPDRIAVTPDGKSAYVSNFGEASVSQYNIDPATGALSPKTPATVPSGVLFGTGGVAVTPDGKSAYVTNGSGSTISQYNIDPVTGGLSPKTPATVFEQFPSDIVVSRDGMSAYVAKAGAFVSQYTVDSVTGTLSPKRPLSVPAGSNVSFRDLAIAPSGKSLYVTNEFDSTVSQYSIDPATGTLSPLTPASVPAGFEPLGIAVAPGVPTSKDDCTDGGWHDFPQFKNQGECISFVQTGQ